jgi:hypothetical protein
VYDHDAAGGFPILSALLAAARRRGRRPGRWIAFAEACAPWRDGTHPAAWELIVEFDLEEQEAAAVAAAGGGEDGGNSEWGEGGGRGEGGGGGGTPLTAQQLRRHVEDFESVA